MRTYVVASIIIIFGLAGIVLKNALPETDWRSPFLTEISSALLVGGVLSILFKVFHERAHTADLRRLMRIHDSVDELGLIEILPEAQAYNFSDMLRDAKELAVVMNDGQRWVGNNSVSLQERFSKRGASTTVFTLNPDGPVINCLAAKVAMQPDELRNKIKQCWSQLEILWDKSSGHGSLKIYALQHYPTRSLFLTESLLVETPYQIASGRARIPVLIYRPVPRQDSPYSFAARDLEELPKEAKQILNKAPRM